MKILPFIRERRIPDVHLKNLTLKEVLNMSELNQHFELNGMAVFEDESGSFWLIFKSEPKDENLMLIFERYSSMEEINKIVGGPS